MRLHFRHFFSMPLLQWKKMMLDLPPSSLWRAWEWFPQHRCLSFCFPHCPEAATKEQRNEARQWPCFGATFANWIPLRPRRGNSPLCTAPVHRVAWSCLVSPNLARRGMGVKTDKNRELKGQNKKVRAADSRLHLYYVRHFNQSANMHTDKSKSTKYTFDFSTLPISWTTFRPRTSKLGACVRVCACQRWATRVTWLDLGRKFEDWRHAWLTLTKDSAWLRLETWLGLEAWEDSAIFCNFFFFF